MPAAVACRSWSFAQLRCVLRVQMGGVPQDLPFFKARSQEGRERRMGGGPLSWAKTRVLKMDTLACRDARFENTSVSKWFLDLF